ncbi:50S ribosomal protein L18 [Candidatus Woesebacteria bacterium RIFCSPHIGHO2_01_FULL_44_21]|uniref:Large ribosomal subunit protein uL18 n=1 Tax=Candidatus Woesebacteria bacterium RIFCSPHIGHO2_01_FULL_44_21 TaxID=1802503 RepID=A0A1F7Z148_9BACT|nr:MAG: 50S ribosomal protein L18 [Candidatus Woesebacteria bacterium RIFCSPHIGHO2_01_FULL_44_21]OGM71473.1 MAG: 50S ribosomal protein L18 [Candidatus Woesebacteria bacterium RIFCSPLOWO2_01_FULL_44_24b]
MLTKSRATRKKRIRARLAGNSTVPRLTVFRSNKLIYAQLINDAKGLTLASAKGKDPKEVALDLVKKAKKAKIGRLVFDRSGYKYHGKIKELADAVREGGIKF